MSKDCVYCANETFALDPSTQKKRLFCNHYLDFIKFDGDIAPCRNQDNCKGFREERNETEDLYNESFSIDQDKNLETDIER